MVLCRFVVIGMLLVMGAVSEAEASARRWWQVGSEVGPRILCKLRAPAVPLVRGGCKPKRLGVRFLSTATSTQSALTPQAKVLLKEVEQKAALFAEGATKEYGKDAFKGKTVTLSLPCTLWTGQNLGLFK